MYCRRQFLKYIGGASLLIGLQGLGGGVIGCSSQFSHAGTVEIDTLPGRPWHHTAELDWHQSKPLNGITITAVPAVHYSSRSPFDRNETLWSGYIINAGHLKTYFSGDTGYHALFKELGQKYGPFDLGIKNLVPMHWGTLVLSLHR